MFVCPKCKGPLSDFYCERCAVRYPVHDGIPCLMAGGADSSDQVLRDIYDDIYSHHTDVWSDQGRTTSFREFFGCLVRDTPHERLLEIGCGEGMLLAALPGTHKWGIDPSIQALQRASRRLNAQFAVARCEQLPFPADAFDVVVAVGVMEHFEEVDTATAEVARVLTPTGHYFVLIHTDMTRAERVAVKVRELLFPRVRPIAILKWVKKKLRHRIVQPMRKSYTLESAKTYLHRNGFQVMRIITRATNPEAPLVGAHVLIIVARKDANQSSPVSLV